MTLLKCDNIFDGEQKIYKADNSYGASVVKHSLSYGGTDDLWELAVIKFDENNNWHITYDTPITDDVLGNLTDEQVFDYLSQIEAL